MPSGFNPSLEFCQFRVDLLTLWSLAAQELSRAAGAKTRDLPEIEKARREAEKCRIAYQDHVREHGCGNEHSTT